MDDGFANPFGASPFGAWPSGTRSSETRPPAGGATLFGEDFDRPPAPPPPPEAVVAAPVFSAAELDTARDAANLAGRDAARAEFETSTKAAAGKALAGIAAQIEAAREEAASIAEQSAAAVARLLLDCFALSFPALSTRHGANEAAAVLREILPALQREPKISVRVNPHIAAAMTSEIQSLDPDLAAKIRLIPTDAMTEGDVRIAWDHGTAVRDAAALWRQIEDVLAPAGLLTTEKTAPEKPITEKSTIAPAPANATTRKTAKEPALVE